MIPTRLLIETLEREQSLIRFELGNLPKEATIRLVDTILPERNPKLATLIYKQTLGHPLHTVELAGLLQDSDNTGKSLPIPKTVRAVMAGRLTRLGQAAEALAETLSKIQTLDIFTHHALTSN